MASGEKIKLQNNFPEKKQSSDISITESRASRKSGKDEDIMKELEDYVNEKK